jgi:glycosyltransferase involved in cell wall biosynthesis
VTPSYWLAEQVKQSFLKDYPIRVIHNGIDLSVFSPQPSDFRKEYHLEHKKIVLGVSMEWGRRKGLDVFIQLAKSLPEDYQIILVGTNAAVDQQLPDHIISIHHTENVQQLAQIYTASDVFANPTRDEVFGLVNVEALACGTPGVTFQSGGSPECYDETCGAVVPCDDVEAILAQIIRICEEKPFSDGACIAFSRNFDKEKKFGEYVSLYKEICS